MKVGLYFDLRNPPQWKTDSARLYSFTLEMCEEAERLGAHSVWFSEHHLFEDGCLTQPLTFCAAAAARTKRIRVGTAILVAPLQKPIQLAEQAVVVDLISGGRLDLGIGTGYRIPECELYGASLEGRYGVTDECARQLRSFWTGGRVTPQPAQARISIWMGYQGPQGAERAGRLGEGLFYGEPAVVAKAVNYRLAGLPVECAFMWASVAGMPERTVADNSRTILTKFAPLLQI